MELIHLYKLLSRSIPFTQHRNILGTLAKLYLLFFTSNIQSVKTTYVHVCMSVHYNTDSQSQ